MLGKLKNWFNGLSTKKVEVVKEPAHVCDMQRKLLTTAMLKDNAPGAMPRRHPHICEVWRCAGCNKGFYKVRRIGSKSDLAVVELTPETKDPELISEEKGWAVRE